MSSSSRNYGRRLFRNVNKKYTDILKRKKSPGITQWTTPRSVGLSPNTNPEIRDIKHIWTTGDRYYKLANQYYQNPEYWWVIASYNQAPTEGHLKIGDVIFIPTPLDVFLGSQ